MNNGRKRLSWEETALRLAGDIANYRSEDCWLQVGACIIKHNGDIVLGYNGPPPQIEIDWSDRDKRRKKIIHAEENALNRVLPGEAKFMAVTCSCCPSCLRIVAQKLIKTVYYKEERPDIEESKALAEEFGIKLIKWDESKV